MQWDFQPNKKRIRYDNLNTVFYICVFNDVYVLYLNLNCNVGYCKYFFEFRKWADHYNEYGRGRDAEDFSIRLEPIKNIVDFYKIAQLIKKSNLKTEEEYRLLLKDYLEKTIYFPDSNLIFSRSGVGYCGFDDLQCLCPLCKEDRLKKQGMSETMTKYISRNNFQSGRLF